MTANFLSDGKLQIPPNFVGSSRIGKPGSTFSYVNSSVKGTSFHSGGVSNETVDFHIDVIVTGALERTSGFSDMVFQPNFAGQNKSQDQSTKFQSVHMEMKGLTTSYKVGSSGNYGGTWYFNKSSGNSTGIYTKFSLVLNYTLVVPYVQPGHSINMTFTSKIYSPSNNIDSGMTLDFGDKNITGITQMPV